MSLPESNQPSGVAGRSGFVDYLSTRSLPVNRATLRAIGAADLTLALIEHAPNAGLWFDPIDDMVVSVVLRAGHSRVVRDVGHGRVEFTDVPGATLLSLPDRPSYWRFDGNPLVLHLSVPNGRLPALLGSGAEDLGRRLTGVPCTDPLVAQLAGRLWEFSGEAGDGAGALVETGLPTMPMLLLRDLSGAGRDGSRPGAPALSPWRLRKVRPLMSDPRQEASVADYARSVALSRSQFGRSFKAATGRTPYRMASEFKIEEAKRLLARTRLSMTAIALELGFSSSAHFSSRFKQLTGMSPTRWRATYAS